MNNYELLRKSALVDRRRLLERELEAVQQELEDLEERFVQVIFLIGPNSPAWADDKRDQCYTYSDPSKSLQVGDLVVAGYFDGIAEVVALGRGEYRGIANPIRYILEKRRLS